jgi:hypothetical protein
LLTKELSFFYAGNMAREMGAPSLYALICSQGPTKAAMLLLEQTMGPGIAEDAPADTNTAEFWGGMDFDEHKPGEVVKAVLGLLYLLNVQGLLGSYLSLAGDKEFFRILLLMLSARCYLINNWTGSYSAEALWVLKHLGCIFPCYEHIHAIAGLSHTLIVGSSHTTGEINTAARLVGYMMLSIASRSTVVAGKPAAASKRRRATTEMLAKAVEERRRVWRSSEMMQRSVHQHVRFTMGGTPVPPPPVSELPGTMPVSYDVPPPAQAMHSRMPVSVPAGRVIRSVACTQSALDAQTHLDDSTGGLATHDSVIDPQRLYVARLGHVPPALQLKKIVGDSNLARRIYEAAFRGASKERAATDNDLENIQNFLILPNLLRVLADFERFEDPLWLRTVPFFSFLVTNLLEHQYIAGTARRAYQHFDGDWPKFMVLQAHFLRSLDAVASKQFVHSALSTHSMVECMAGQDAEGPGPRIAEVVRSHSDFYFRNHILEHFHSIVARLMTERSTENLCRAAADIKRLETAADTLEAQFPRPVRRRPITRTFAPEQHEQAYNFLSELFHFAANPLLPIRLDSKSGIFSLGYGDELIQWNVSQCCGYSAFPSDTHIKAEIDFVKSHWHGSLSGAKPDPSQTAAFEEVVQVLLNPPSLETLTERSPIIRELAKQVKGAAEPVMKSMPTSGTAQVAPVLYPPDWSPPPAPAEDDSDGSEYYSSSSGGSYEDESPGIHEGRYDTRSTGVKRGASEADPLL